MKRKILIFQTHRWLNLL